MIDLHTHTTESDGTFTPQELVGAAADLGLEALAITDHDTFLGYDTALPSAQERGLDLICGIELSTKFRHQSVHLLGYFLKGDPPEDFRQWITSTQKTRHQRNEELVRKLQACGVNIDLAEVYDIGGRLPGRPHFASLLIAKKYVSSRQQAFDEYLSESGKCFVSRDEHSLEECIQRLESSGGIASLAHPIRFLRDSATAEETIRHLMDTGLRAIEVHHSDYTSMDTQSYLEMSQRLKLLSTGGSDFHGANKPMVSLGTGKQGNVCVPKVLLDELRQQA